MKGVPMYFNIGMETAAYSVHICVRAKQTQEWHVKGSGR